MDYEERADVWFRHFTDVAAVFQARFMRPLWERYPLSESDPWDSLSLFLEGYAFERQGRRPDYAPAAIDSVADLKNHGASVNAPDTPGAVWAKFSKYLNQKGLNEGNNPLSPKGTPFEKKRKQGGPIRVQTKKPSVLEFAAEIVITSSHPTLTSVLSHMLQQDDAQRAHRALKNINGVGPKVASLFLRDLAVHYNCTVEKCRHLLQPIDIWVRRIARELGGPVDDPSGQNPKVDERVGIWIVRTSVDKAVSAELVNQGMWYFAREIVGSYFLLKKSIADPDFSNELFVQHEKVLNGAVKAVAAITRQI